MAVHSVLGPGLLENTYELCLAHELSKCGLQIRQQVLIPLRYLTIENAYRIDLLINDLVMVEVKAIETIHPVHRGQLLSYLRLGRFKLGYLLNFNVAHMRDGITRLANGLRSFCAKFFAVFKLDVCGTAKSYLNLKSAAIHTGTLKETLWLSCAVDEMLSSFLFPTLPLMPPIDSTLISPRTPFFVDELVSVFSVTAIDTSNSM